MNLLSEKSPAQHTVALATHKFCVETADFCVDLIYLFFFHDLNTLLFSFCVKAERIFYLLISSPSVPSRQEEARPKPGMQI